VARIFVSHSQRDDDIKSLFSMAFASTNVMAVFEEIERIRRKEITSFQVGQDVNSSNAIFVLLSKNVTEIPYTRDWIAAESGIGWNKDVWVFEPYWQSGEIDVVIPMVRHYVVYQNDSASLDYIRRIIESYDDSHVGLATILGTLVGAGLGHAIAEEEKGLGAVAGGAIGGAAGMYFADKSRIRPIGAGLRCPGCNNVYAIHVPLDQMTIRCPVCNTLLDISQIIRQTAIPFPTTRMRLREFFLESFDGRRGVRTKRKKKGKGFSELVLLYHAGIEF